ncbi:MAG: BsaWI family type II restriction enzyme [Verrucomicrobiia bacterium]
MDNQTAQRARAAAGGNLEYVVARILNELLNSQDIFVVKGTKSELQRVLQDKAQVEQIINYCRLPVKRPCDQKQLEDYPDTDLFVLYKRSTDFRVLAVISCKVSFHARHTEVAFWGLAIRISSNMKYVCVTEDADIYDGKKSELGASCTQSRATRRILESYTTRTYLIKKYESTEDQHLVRDIAAFRNQLTQSTRSLRRDEPCFDNPVKSNHTEYCPGICPLDELYFDILRWRDESFGEK